MRLRSTLPARLRRASLAVALIVAWSRLADLGPPAARAEQQPPPPDLRRTAEMLKRLIQVAGVADRSVLGRMLDPIAIVRAAGQDPAKLCAWVSDNTCWVPYHGVLRGSTGVLLDRLGNSADRAVLLADLVRTAGYETRLARATLPDAVANALLAKVHRVADDWRPPTFDDPDGGDPAINDALRQFGLDPNVIHRRQASAELRSDQLVETIVGRSTEQAPAVAALAWPGGTATAAHPDAAAVAERAALADHWWVECRQHPSDAWSGLDPTCGGTPPVAATETIARAADGRFAFPTSSAHEVEIRIVREQWHDGGLHQDVVLRQTLRPKDVVGQPILIGHQPIGWPSPLDLSGEVDPAGKFRQLVAALREWVPTLMVGPQAITQGGINADGSIDPKPVLDAMTQTGGTAGKGANAAADLLGDAAQPTAPVKPTGVLTAEWIEYEIRTPGRDRPQVVRRDLFDSIGPAARAAGVTAMPVFTEPQLVEQGLARLGLTDVALQPCAIPAAFVGHLAAQALVANGDVIVGTVAAPPTDYAALDAMAGKLVPSSIPLYSLASTRFTASRVGGSVYIDHVNVLERHQRLRAQPPTGAGGAAFSQLVAFDVVENGVAVHRRDRTDPARVRLEQGVVDTVAESVLLVADGRPTTNTSDAFGGDAAAGHPWTAVTPADAGRLAAMGLPADVRARLVGEFTAGRTVLLSNAPAGSAGPTWWSVDPATGQTLGIAANGWGASMTEYAFIIKLIFKVGVFVGCVMALDGTGTTPAKRQQQIRMGGFCLLGAVVSITGLIAGSELIAGVLGVAGDGLSIGSSVYSIVTR